MAIRRSTSATGRASLADGQDPRSRGPRTADPAAVSPGHTRRPSCANWTRRSSPAPRARSCAARACTAAASSSGESSAPPVIPEPWPEPAARQRPIRSSPRTSALPDQGQPSPDAPQASREVIAVQGNVSALLREHYPQERRAQARAMIATAVNEPGVGGGHACRLRRARDLAGDPLSA